MTEKRATNQTTTHQITLTFTVAAINEGAVEDLIHDMAGQIHHHAYYSQDVSLVEGTLNGSYIL